MAAFQNCRFEETINTLKYANRAKNLKTQVARNVVSVSAHIAEYQRVIMELRNEVADLKAEMKSGAGGGTALGLPAEVSVGSTSHRKQRSLDYVDNLEKQHMQQLKDAVMSAMSERRRLLSKLTDHSRALSEARGQEQEQAEKARDANAADAAAQPTDAGQHAELHSAIAATRRQLQQNQQTINEIIATAVQRISSQERLQLLQLLVRGKFLEVMNEEMSTELEMRRALAQAAMKSGSLPPALMNEAMSTESWYTEHRTALDYHAKMAKTQMGGSMHAPSIAQLLDQNLVSPQQANASQNIGDLVRPFTNHGPKAPPKALKASPGKQPLHDASRAGGGRKISREGVPSPIPANGSSGGGSSSALLTNLVDDDNDEDRNSSTSASDRGSRYGNSAASSGSRGPTAGARPGGSRGPPNGIPNALRGLSRLPPGAKPLRPVGGQRTTSASSRQSPTHSQPPTPYGSRPPSLGPNGGPTTTVTKLNQPPQPIKRFQPPPPQRFQQQPVKRFQPGVPTNSQLPANAGIVRAAPGLPTINGSGAVGAPLNAVQLASARAAAAARQPQRAQAISSAYGGPPALNANLQRRTSHDRSNVPNFGSRPRPGLPPPRPAYNVGGGAGPPQLGGAGGGPAYGYREGNRGLPPAAPSARLAARLQGGPPRIE